MESEEHQTNRLPKAVLPHSNTSGPAGLGDPNDRSLRKVETEVLIPRLMQDYARMVNCAKVSEEFNKCGNDWGLLLVVKCRQVNKRLVECLTNCYKNEEFKKEITELYLEKRKKYRETGKGEKMRAIYDLR